GLRGPGVVGSRLLGAGQAGGHAGRQDPPRSQASGSTRRGSGADRSRGEPQDRRPLRPHRAAQDPAARRRLPPMKTAGSRGRLFRKYVVVLLVLMGGVLMASSLVELYFSYREPQRSIVRVERAKAVAAAAGTTRRVSEA